MEEVVAADFLGFLITLQPVLQVVEIEFDFRINPEMTQLVDAVSYTLNDYVSALGSSIAWLGALRTRGVWNGCSFCCELLPCYHNQTHKHTHTHARARAHTHTHYTPPQNLHQRTAAALGVMMLKVWYRLSEEKTRAAIEPEYYQEYELMDV